MRLFYTVFERKLSPNAIQAILSGQKHNIPDNKTENTKSSLKNNTSGDNKAQLKLPDGPDDVSPDIDLEKTKKPKIEKKKRGPKPKKALKKVLDTEFEESVKEAMSESEEQLAKLTLDCSGDKTRLAQGINETTVTKLDNSENENDKNSVAEAVAKNTHEDCCDDKNGSETDPAEENMDDTKVDSNLKASPTGSVHLTLFQPLNSEPSEVKSDTGCFKSYTLYDFKGEESPSKDKPNSETKVQKRGRPKGSKNKNTNKVVEECSDKTSGDKTPVSKPKKEVSKKVKKDANSANVESSKKAKKDDSSANEQVSKDSKETKQTCKAESEGGQKAKVKRKYVKKAKEESEKDMPPAKKAKLAESGEFFDDSKRNVDKDKIQNTETKTSDNVDATECVKDATESKCDSPKPDNITGDENKCSDINKKVEFESGIPAGSTCLIEPVTPLYGETPNVKESNQGLPCSPNMSGVEITKPSINTDEPAVKNDGDLNGAIKENGDKNSTLNKENKTDSHEQNFAHGERKNGIEAIKSLPSSFAGFEQCIPVVSVVRPVIPTVHFTYNNVACTSTSPYFGGFPSPLVNAHSRFSPALRPNGPYMVLDPNMDQPLDLTNNVAKDQYTKGKIFKTKMLKKHCAKTDASTQVKDKSANGSNAAHTFPQ